jgi:hypothetical protein
MLRFPMVSPDLSEMHVYGNLLEIYSLEVETSIENAGALYNDVKELDRALLAAYIAFVLAKAGYDMEILTGGTTPQFTTSFNTLDWVGFCDYYPNFLENMSIDFVGEWEEIFNKDGSRINVCIWDYSPDPLIPFTSETVHKMAVRDKEEISGPRYSRYINVIHPRIAREQSDAFHERQAIFKTENLELVSTGQLLWMFVSDEKRKFVEDEWSEIRNGVIKRLVKTWPVIAVHQQMKLYLQSKEQLRLSRAKFDMGYMADSIKDAGVACEGILSIMTDMYEPRTMKDRPEFNELLEILNRDICLELGEDISKDLNYIREQRNQVVHPPYRVPSSTVAVKVLAKAELFVNIFERQIMQRSRKPSLVSMEARTKLE